MGATSIIVLICSILLVVEGVIKIVKPDYKIRGNPPPSGYTITILGVGLLLAAIGV